MNCKVITNAVRWERFDGSFWNGAKTAFARDVKLTVLGGGAIRVVSTGPAKDDAASVQGTLRKNGSIDAAGRSGADNPLNGTAASDNIYGLAGDDVDAPRRSVDRSDALAADEFE